MQTEKTIHRGSRSGIFTGEKAQLGFRCSATEKALLKRIGKRVNLGYGPFCRQLVLHVINGRRARVRLGLNDIDQAAFDALLAQARADAIAAGDDPDESQMGLIELTVEEKALIKATAQEHKSTATAQPSTMAAYVYFLIFTTIAPVADKKNVA